MSPSRFARLALPTVAAAASAVAAVSWVAWLRARHCAPVADVYRAGFRDGRAQVAR